MKDINFEIKNCNKCGDLPKLVCDTIKFGSSKILILGESPAKDGWIVSGRAFYNKNGKLQATGKVLNKLLNLINLTIEDITFTEVCKCVIENRKQLRQCSDNCKPILFEQLKNINCEIILPMGLYPTEALLNKKLKLLKDVVGQKFEMDFGNTKKLVIPIYHTSPANPLCYSGNEQIFLSLKNLL